MRIAPIIAYHGVEQTLPDVRGVCFGGRTFVLNALRVTLPSFRNQLSFLRQKGYRSVGLDEIMAARESEGRQTEKIFAMTFDDGFNDLHFPTKRLLREFGYTATVFLVAGKITDEGRNGFLTWQQVREMRREGFRFGAHTLSHPFLTSIGLEEARREICDSKRIIEEKLQTGIDFFCYPFGDFDSTTINLVKDAGFKGALVTPTRPGTAETPFTMRRVGVNRGNSMFTFKTKLSGSYDVFRDNRTLYQISRVRQRLLLSLTTEVE
ncbi:polysaccharide deacetylase family protein [Candidatus Poribacteria bacterium]|nr:polysaccharide deacetylase family protein [Candidatus Poribacteria bacterium]